MSRRSTKKEEATASAAPASPAAASATPASPAAASATPASPAVASASPAPASASPAPASASPAPASASPAPASPAPAPASPTPAPASAAPPPERLRIYSRRGKNTTRKEKSTINYMKNAAKKKLKAMVNTIRPWIGFKPDQCAEIIGKGLPDSKEAIESLGPPPVQPVRVGGINALYGNAAKKFDEDSKNYYEYEEKLNIIQKLYRGEWPTMPRFAPGENHNRTAKGNNDELKKYVKVLKKLPRKDQVQLGKYAICVLQGNFEQATTEEKKKRIHDNLKVVHEILGDINKKTFSTRKNR